MSTSSSGAPSTPSQPGPTPLGRTSRIVSLRGWMPRTLNSSTASAISTIVVGRTSVVRQTSELQWFLWWKGFSLHVRGPCQLRSRMMSVMCHPRRMTCLPFFWLQVPKPKANAKPAKGKGKRTRADDIPPPTPLKLVKVVDHLRDLQERLLCAKHSKPGMRTYCWIEVAENGVKGGHREFSHSELTLWAKYIVRQ